MCTTGHPKKLISAVTSKNENHQSGYTLTIPIEINKHIVYGLLDTGAQTSLLSKNIIGKLYPDWTDMPEAAGPKQGVTASGAVFQFHGNRQIPVTIGKCTKKVTFSIADTDSDIILGLNGLKAFKITIHFTSTGVEILASDKLVGIFPLENPLKLFGTNANAIHAEPFSGGQFLANCFLDIPPDTNILVTASNSRAILPAIVSSNQIEGRQILLLRRNDSEEIIELPSSSQTLHFDILDKEDIIINHDNMNGEVELFSPPTRFKNNNDTLNKEFYRNDQEGVTAEINAILLNSTVEDIPDSSTTNFSGAIGIPDNVYRSPKEVVEEELDHSLDPEVRKQLKEIFEDYPEVVSTHAFDCGLLRNHLKEPIYMDVPLKCKLPHSSHFYQLSDEDNKHLEDIMSFLIFHELAKPADKDKQTGSPAFLVRRSGGGAKAPRMVLDLRFVNRFVSTPISTPSNSVLNVISEVGAGADFITAIDLANAYYSVPLSKETIDSGVANIYLKNSTYSLLRGITGLNMLPNWWAVTVGNELEKDEKGRKAPLTTANTTVRLWYDDSISSSQGDLWKHLTLVREVIRRFARMGLKIGLRKSTFCVNLSTNHIDILGFCLRKNEISPSKTKTDKLLAAEIPKNRTELMSFLGLFNFLRNLLKPSAVHMASKLSELTSTSREFIWTDKHTHAFNEIKSMISCHIAKVNIPTHGQIRFLYADSSDSLMGGICFYLDSEEKEKIGHRDFGKIETDEELLETLKKELGVDPLSKIYTPPTNKKHTKHDKIKNCLNKFVQVMNSDELPPEADYISLLIFTIHTNLKKLLYTIGYNENEVRHFIADLRENGEKAKTLEDTHLILLLLSWVIKRDSYLITNNAEGVIIHQCCGDFGQLVAPLTIIQMKDGVHLLLLNETMQYKNWILQSHADVTLYESKEPSMIYSYFKQILANKEMSSKIKIQGNFSKTFSASEKALPIYQKEILAILNVLDHFKTSIEDSKLTLLMTDNSAAFFLMSPKVGQTVKKIGRYFLKVALDYPNVRLLVVPTKQQAADYFSRMGISRTQFFENTLTPVYLDKKLLEPYEGEALTWSEVRGIIEDHPDIIKFSEKRLRVEELNFYTEHYCTKDQECIRPEEAAKVNSLQNDHPKIGPLSMFDKFLSRARIIQEQKREFDVEKLVEDGMGCELRNEVLHFHNKPMLPKSLYGITSMREHYLLLHGSMMSLKDNVMQIYHVPYPGVLKQIIQELIHRCLICMSIKANLQRKVVQGLFPMQKAQHSIQLDFIEGLPSKTNILTVVNMYSRFLTVFVMKKMTTEAVINAMITYIGSTGRISHVTTDNAGLFATKRFEDFLKSLGIFKLTSSPYRPICRAVVERFNGLIQQAVNVLAFPKSEDWKKFLPIATAYLNRRRLDHLRVSPYELEYGRFIQHDDSTSRKEIEEIDQGHIKESEYAKRHAANATFQEEIKRIEQVSDARKERLLEKRNQHKVDVKLSEGSFVLIKNRGITVGTTSKLKFLYERVPYKVMKVTKGNGYFLQNIVSLGVTRRHYDDLKLICIEPLLDDALNLPKPVAEIMYNLKYEHLCQDFPFFQNPEKPTRRITRQQVREEKNLRDLEQEDFEAFLDEVHKEVRFDDDD